MCLGGHCRATDDVGHRGPLWIAQRAPEQCQPGEGDRLPDADRGRAADPARIAFCHAVDFGLCATGFASATSIDHARCDTLAEPVAPEFKLLERTFVRSPFSERNAACVDSFSRGGISRERPLPGVTRLQTGKSHGMQESLRGQILIAGVRLRDPNFFKTIGAHYRAQRRRGDGTGDQPTVFDDGGQRTRRSLRSAADGRRGIPGVVRSNRRRCSSFTTWVVWMSNRSRSCRASSSGTTRKSSSK